MKKAIFLLLLIISTSVISAQKTITYEEMKTITKSVFQQIDCDIYIAKLGIL